ncbi:MAG: prolyl oligopeptidase family serine peptidase [Bacteroidota bacterium]
MRLLSAGFALLSVGHAASAQSLDAFLAAPHRSGLVAAPTMDRLAWVENVEGVRAIWVADGPTFTPRRVTAFTEDDGQTVSGLRFTPDGTVLLYTYGDGRNRYGEYPNPTTAAAAPLQETRALRLGPLGRPQPDSTWIAAQGAAGALHPDGAHVLLVRGGTVRLAPLDPNEDPEPLFSVRGSVGGATWSPDGTQLAFVSRRGGHALLGLYQLGATRVRWIAPSVDRDRSPTWSPDGTRLAFYRFEGPGLDVAYTGFGPESEPYDVWVADVASGEAQPVWRVPRDGRQGFPSIQGRRDLAWADNQTVVFPAEVEGWLHLYAVPAAGGPARNLTPGACMNEDAVVAGGMLYVTHNCGAGDGLGLDRRSLAQIRITDGQRTPLTDGGREVVWSPVPLTDGVAYVRATWDQPGAVTVQAAGQDARRLDTEAVSPFQATLLVEPEAVTFVTDDGFTIHAQLFLPPEPAAEAQPAVVFLHGGSRRQMFPAFHMSGYYHNAYAFNQYLARQGYVVLSINFRSGIGYGKAFRQPAGYGWQGAAEYRDVLAARRWLAARADVDDTRIGLWGGSYGGYLTALGLARDSDLFAVGVDLHGVHDWTTTLRFWGSDLFDLSAPEHAARADSLQRLAFQSSPNADLHRWTSPVLLIHGDDDRNVDVDETRDLVRRLRAKGDVEFEVLLIPDDVHGFLRYAHWHQAYTAAAAFLNRHLRPASASQP